MTTRLSPDTDYAETPLYRRDGSVLGYAKIDKSQFEAVSRHRWHVSSLGYVCRSERQPDGSLITRLLHREVLGLPVYGRPKVRFVSNDKLDLRRANLRLSTSWIIETVQRDPSIAAAVLRRAPKALRAVA